MLFINFRFSNKFLKLKTKKSPRGQNGNFTFERRKISLLLSWVSLEPIIANLSLVDNKKLFC